VAERNAASNEKYARELNLFFCFQFQCWLVQRYSDRWTVGRTGEP